MIKNNLINLFFFYKINIEFYFIMEQTQLPNAIIQTQLVEDKDKIQNFINLFDLSNLKDYKPLNITLEKIKNKIGETIKNYENNKKNYEQIKNNLDTYSKRLGDLNTFVTEALTKLKTNIDTTKFNNLINSIDTKLESYNNQIKNKLWTNNLNEETERIIDYNNDNPDKYDVFFIPENNDINEFNNQLLILLSPFLNNLTDIIDKKNLNKKKEEIIKQLDSELTNLNKIIEFAKTFNKYIKEKKIVIDNILNIQYNSNDIKKIEKNKISSNDYLIDRTKKIKLDNKKELNLSEIKNIQLHLKTALDNLNINENINKINNINLVQLENFDILNNIDDIITINIPLQGGQYEFETQFVFDNETNNKIIDILQLINNLFGILENILDEAKYLKQLQFRYNFYCAYIFLIVKNTLEDNEKKVYNYLSKEIIEKYIEILIKIKNKFTNMTIFDPHLVYLNKYHYITHEKVLNVLTFLNNNINNTELIDINNCTEDVYNDLILFNNYKSLILQYLNTASK